jgi:hypothetical protein
MDRLLTDQEIADLTGLVQASAQKRWLEQNGIHYFQRSDGQPRTTWHHVNHPMLRKAAVNDSASTPDFGALRNGT